MAYEIGVLLIALALSWSVNAIAYEFSGKLERLDSNTLTLLGKNSDKKTGRICREQRAQAARFLGKSVVVNFEKQQGEEWAISVEALR
ncbi:MAG: hypothetical protein M1511_11605 [Deltaproteobacteria bacterium]|nr:hypothetical protein [Deltaproteobacteria bacterium]